MKKSIISIIAAVAMLGALTGCADLTGKKDDISEKSKAWKSPHTEKVTELGTMASVVVEMDKYTPNWWCWTDDQGRVFNVYEPNKVTAEGKTTWTFTFTSVEEKSKYVLYLGFSDYPATKLSNNQTTDDVDFRGTVTVKPGYATMIKASNFSEYIKTVGILTIENNEPKSGSLFTNGDYTITEIWPLQPKDSTKTKIGEKYRVIGDMRFQNLSVKNGEQVKVLLSAKDDLIVGLYQPNRNKKTDGETAATCKYTSWEAALKAVPTLGTDWNVTSLEEYVEANINSMFADKVRMQRHSEVFTHYFLDGNGVETSQQIAKIYSNSFNTNRFNYKAGKDDLIRTKTADGEEIIEEIIEVETGSFEK